MLLDDPVEVDMPIRLDREHDQHMPRDRVPERQHQRAGRDLEKGRVEGDVGPVEASQSPWAPSIASMHASSLARAAASLRTTPDAICAPRRSIATRASWSCRAQPASKAATVDAASRVGDDDALAREDADGLADRNPADAEHVRKLGLDQAHAGPQAPRRDGLDDPVRHLVGESHMGDRLERQRCEIGLDQNSVSGSVYSVLNTELL